MYRITGNDATKTRRMTPRTVERLRMDRCGAGGGKGGGRGGEKRGIRRGLAGRSGRYRIITLAFSLSLRIGEGVGVAPPPSPPSIPRYFI